MGLLKRLKEIAFTQPELKGFSELYANRKYWDILIKVHNMRIAQLTEESLGINTLTSEGQIKDHGVKERIRENELYIDLFEQEVKSQEKARKVEEHKQLRRDRFKPIKSLFDL